MRACISQHADSEVASRFYMFPHYIETTTFGISCDAYNNLKETLTRHKPMVAEYLDKNYDRVRLVCICRVRRTDPARSSLRPTRN